jgi:hypothetical protein
MSQEIIPIQEWMKTFRGAADDLARTSLRFDPSSSSSKPTKPAKPVEPGEPGAYIAILSPNNAVHLGLSAGPVQCRALARALLGLRHDEELSESDVVDGLSEVMNILAGKVKASMSGRDGQLHLGLPMFVPNPVRAGGGSEAVTADVQLGPVDCTLRVYRRQRAA